MILLVKKGLKMTVNKEAEESKQVQEEEEEEEEIVEKPNDCFASLDYEGTPEETDAFYDECIEPRRRD